MVPQLNLGALKLLELGIKHDIQLSINWVSRDDNTQADELSKVDDQNDWGIDQRIFNLLESKYGPFTIDLFASNITQNLPRFYAKYW